MTSRTVNGNKVTYTYDAANRLTSMTTPDGQVTRFGYDSDGRRTDTWWHTNTDHSTFAAHTHNDFDKSGRLVRSWTSRASSDITRIFDSSYSYAKSGGDTGLVQTITDNTASANNVATLSYDSQNRLTKAAGWQGHTYVYSYDVDGNRTTATVDGTSAQSLAFNSDNEITSTGYAYDKAGRRTSDAHGGTMTYNAAGQMTKQVVGSATDTFMYAGAGQNELVQQNTTGSSPSSYSYIYGRGNQAGIPEVEEVTSPTTTQIWDNDAAGQPIDYVANGTAYFMVYDGLGQFIATMLANGTQNGGNIQYDPYGAFLADTLPGANPTATQSAKTARTMSTGTDAPWTTLGIGDNVSRWWKRGQRWNDTITGTWTTVDPMTRLNDPNRANSYTYVGDDPINAIDPSGRDWWDDVTSIVTSAAACVGPGLATGALGYDYGWLLGPDGAAAGGAIGFIYGCGAGIISAGSTGYNLFNDYQKPSYP